MVSTKKDVAEMSIEQKLKTLFDLQQMLSEIDRIRILRGELPLEVQDLEDEIEGLTTRLERYEQEIKTATTDIAKKKAGIADAQALVERYNQQINEVRNNREYDSLQKEIEFQNLEIQLLNKRIGEAQRTIEATEQKMAEARETLSDRRTDLEIKKSELEEIVAETRAQEEKLRENAKNLELKVDTRLLMSFKRIRKAARNGLGIVYVQRDACGGCFNKIPPQRQLDVRMHKKIIPCEYCGRILIDPELAGVNLNPTEEKPKKRGARRTKKTEE